MVQHHISFREAKIIFDRSWDFSIYNGTSDVSQAKLVDVNQINISDDPALYGELDKLGVDRTQDNYALKLDPGDSITHDRFVVPDWGVLRFDLHVPDSEPSTAPQNSVIRVFLDNTELLSSAFQGLKPTERKSNGNPNVSANEYPAVDLREFNPNTLPGLNPKIAQAQSNRVGFAQQGFQTFQVDIPNQFRGRVATLRFEVSGDKTVDLDNFFKSQHLLFGSPALNGQEARKDIDTPNFSDNYFILNNQEPSSVFRTNYLFEKPQYSLSYNDDTRTPNWVSYQLNKSWLGSYNSKPVFQSDPSLPFVTQKGVTDSDINAASNYQKGHMTAAADRSRNQQDYYATFLTTNILPQPSEYPNNNDQWTKLEEYLRKILNNDNKELYIIAGRHGQALDSSGLPLILPQNPATGKVSVPDGAWKVVLVLDRPGLGISDVTNNTIAFGIYLPNTLDSNNQGKDPNGDWAHNFTINGVTFGLFNVAQIEGITGYNFFSNLPIDIQQAIKNRSVTDMRTQLNFIQPTPLMAATEEDLPLRIGTNFDSPIGHSGIPNQITPTTNIGFGSSGISEISTSHNGMFPVSWSQISTNENSPTQVGMTQVSSTQIGPIQGNHTQVGGEQISISQNRFEQTSLSQESSEQISSSQISTHQIDSFKVSPPQIDPAQANTFKSFDRTTNTISFGDGNHSNASKVTLPSIVPSQQIISSDFPSHNLTPESINPIEYTALTLWNSLLKPQTPFNVKIELSSLVQGQLAEAQITKYDSQGRPTGGNVLISPDANGKGWFIDPTLYDSNFD